MLLSTDGSRITNRDGRPVALRGFGLGGWMNMENFITGYPANEEAHARGRSAVLGDDRYTSSLRPLPRALLHRGRRAVYPVARPNVAAIADIFSGTSRTTCVLWRSRRRASRHLDRVVELCARHKIYTIIDLHALPRIPEPALALGQPDPQGIPLEAQALPGQDSEPLGGHRQALQGQPVGGRLQPINEPADPTRRSSCPYTGGSTKRSGP